MGNIKSWLTKAVGEFGEEIESIVVGQHYNAKWDVPVNADENIMLPVKQALKKLNVDYDNGYGGADCFPIYAWTKSRVFFIHEYDGATGLNWVPRNPIDCKPEFGGNS